VAPTEELVLRAVCMPVQTEKVYFSDEQSGSIRVGQLTKLIVDEKHRVTLPRELRESLGITSGSKLEAEEKGNEIVIRPVVPIEKPTGEIWGLAPRAADRNPKKQARQAIASRKRLGK